MSHKWHPIQCDSCVNASNEMQIGCSSIWSTWCTHPTTAIPNNWNRQKKTKMTKLSMHWHNSDKLFVYPKMHRIFCADFCRLLISLIAQTHGRHPIASKRNRQLQTVKTNKIIRKKTFSIREQFVYLLWCCLPNSTSEAIGMEHMKMPVHNQWHFIDGHYPTFHLSQCS